MKCSGLNKWSPTEHRSSLAPNIVQLHYELVRLTNTFSSAQILGFLADRFYDKLGNWYQMNLNDMQSSLVRQTAKAQLAIQGCSCENGRTKLCEERRNHRGHKQAAGAEESRKSCLRCGDMALMCSRLTQFGEPAAEDPLTGEG